MLGHLLCAALAGLTMSSEEDSSPALTWGDPAPAIEVQEFVHGTPVAQFEPGQVYVVEFWATWCVPCLNSIPHLTRLQKKHENVIVLGISVDDETDAVAPFVKKLRSKIGYRVAIDARPEGADEGAMMKSWLHAARQDGIPAAFIVNGEGRIAWIGHPTDLDEPLEKILAGTWNLEAQAERHAAAQELEQKKESAAAGLYIALADKEYDLALEKLDAMFALDPAAEAEQGGLKLWILHHAGDQEATLEYAEHLLDAAGDDIARLIEIAGVIVCPDDYALGDFSGMHVDDGDHEQTGDDQSESEMPAEDGDAEDAMEEEGDEKETRSTADESDQAADDGEAAMEDLGDSSSSEEESSEEGSPEISDPLLRLAARAARRASDAAEAAGDLEQQSEAARVLARAYAAAGHSAAGQEVLQRAVEALQESIDARNQWLQRLEYELERME